MQILDSLEHVGAKTFFVREPRAFFENAAFDAAAEMFDEIAVEFRIDFADGTGGIQSDTGGLRAGLPAVKEGGRGGEQSGELTA
ncbi:MAG TPA: hypothetical protein VE086_00630 [Chthoniobacterales bacterium]|nr:hypothetical protein [Chthoniobacterales bacterium]